MNWACCATVASLTLALAVEAEATTFTGPPAGSWFVQENWSNGQVPDETTDVLLPDGVSAIVDAGQDATARGLDMVGNAFLTQQSGSAVFEGARTMSGSARFDLFSSFLSGGALSVDCEACRIAGNPSAIERTSISLQSVVLSMGLGGALPASRNQLGAGFYATMTASQDIVLLADVGLELFLAHGFQPTAGDVFQILTAGGALAGQFAGLPEGALVESFGGIGLFITYEAGDGDDIAVVAQQAPAPESFALFCLGVLGLGLRARPGRSRLPVWRSGAPRR